jgi:hypothetical protein
MKKITLYSLGTIMALGATVIANAQNIRPLAKPMPVKAQVMERKVLQDKLASSTQAGKEEIKDLREKMASTSKELKGEVMEKKAENEFTKMNTRLEATIDREEAIMTKLSSRIEKVKSEGGKTTEAEGLVLEAKTNFEDARADLAVLKTQSETITATSTKSTVKETLTLLRKSTEEIKTHLQNGHVALEKALGSLKGLSQMRTATSTKSN